MAVIDSDEKFRLAASNWIESNPGVFQGTRFVDATGRKIYDERPQPVDVTPDTATLEAALDNANAGVAEEAALQTTRDIALASAKIYLRNQLRSVSPNPTTIFNTIKGYVDSNASLLLMVENQIDLMSIALVWTTATVKAGTLLIDRTRYILAAQMVIGVLE